MDFAQMEGYVLLYGTRMVITLVLLFVGWQIIGFFRKKITKILTVRNIDVTLRPIIVSIIDVLMKIMLLLAMASTMGIAITSFIAVLGAASLTIGLALQGSLANLAGSMLLLVFRPFKVDEYIKAQGVEGFVKEITLFSTVLETPDKTTIFLPNGALANGNIINVSRVGIVRLHINIGVSYSANLKNVRKVLLEAMNNNTLVLTEPKAAVVVVALGDSSVDLSLRPWCKANDAPMVTVQVLEEAKEALDKANIEIPYPHQVVYHQNAIA